ncbi:hypothetical protein [Aquisalibacillus elongatus]|uniref:Uncharacterized protein n=1 Tax=Aquisalibacillus elongatus TaxID=485577 RepID=A0A3N5CHM6_9BACI|nr:hypothetical protein [Aquisalibacillus elongatus]RPF57071.1 hypothetical protein EDC24_0022 [Aquisalibacillus elongatus]
MLYTFLIVLGSLILGFLLYQVPLIQQVFSHSDLSGMFQLANFIILIVILYLLLKDRTDY